MPALCKLIFRLDFPYNYQFLDSLGTAVRIMSENVEEPWDAVTEEPVRHSIQAFKKKSQAWFNLAFEPLTVNGVWEDLSGLDLRKVIESDIFRLYDEKVREFGKTFSVTTVTRAGIRFFCTEVSGWEEGELARLMGLSKEAGIDALKDLLGMPAQFGIFFSGKAPDEVGYTVNLASATELDILRFYANLPLSQEQRAAFLKNRIVFDIDLYETNFSFAEHSLARWSRTKVDKAAILISEIRELIKKMRED